MKQGPRLRRGPFLFKEIVMWKLVVGFVVIAGLALYLLTKGGDIDMSGEKHGSVKTHGFSVKV